MLYITWPINCYISTSLFHALLGLLLMSEPSDSHNRLVEIEQLICHFINIDKALPHSIEHSKEKTCLVNLLYIVDVILDFQRNCLEMMSLMEYYY